MPNSRYRVVRAAVDVGLVLETPVPRMWMAVREGLLWLLNKMPAGRIWRVVRLKLSLLRLAARPQRSETRETVRSGSWGSLAENWP